MLDYDFPETPRQNGRAISLTIPEVKAIGAFRDVDRACTEWLRGRGLLYQSMFAPTADRSGWYQRGKPAAATNKGGRD